MRNQRYIVLTLALIVLCSWQAVFAELLPPSNNPNLPPPPSWVPAPSNHTPEAPNKLVVNRRAYQQEIDLTTGTYTVQFTSKSNESCAHLGSCVKCISNSFGVAPSIGNTSCHVDQYVPSPNSSNYFYMRIVSLPQGKDSYVYVSGPGLYQSYSDACMIGSGYNFVSDLYQKPNSRASAHVTYDVQNIVGPRGVPGKYHTWLFQEGGYIALYVYDADIYLNFCLHALIVISTPARDGFYYYDTAAFDAALTLWAAHSATC